eukprot:COSAG01_NODE_4770_length_4754_cov_5.256713_2_plen_56_part_00
MAWDSLIRPEISRSIDPSCIACWLRFTGESILAETSDWLASEFGLLSIPVGVGQL